MLKLIKRLLERNALIIAISITLLVAVLSLISLKGVVKIEISNSDKYGHLIAYITLGISWFHVFRYRRNSWIYITLILIIFGMILEALQGALTTYRTADWQDGLANATGIIIALMSARLWFEKQEN